MIIEELFLQGFGKFAEGTRFAFSPGLNVVLGDNEAGKTTLMNAFKAAFFAQRRHLDRWLTWGSEAECVVELTYRLDGVNAYCLRRVLPGDLVVSCNGSRIAGGGTAHKRLALGHLGLGEEKLFDNTVFVSAGELAADWSDTETRALRNHLENLLTGDGGAGAAQALRELDNKMKQLAGPPRAAGAGGLIGELETEIARRQAEMDGAEEAAGRLAAQQERLEAVEQELAETRREIEEVRPLTTKLKERSRVEDELAALEVRRAERAAVLERLEATKQEMASLQTELASYSNVKALPEDTLARALSLQALMKRPTGRPDTGRVPLPLLAASLFGVIATSVLLVLDIDAAAAVAALATLVFLVWATQARTGRSRGQSDLEGVREELKGLLSQAGVAGVDELKAALARVGALERDIGPLKGKLSELAGHQSEEELRRGYQELLDEIYKRQRYISELDESLPTRISPQEAARLTARLEELERLGMDLDRESVRLRAGLEATARVDLLKMREEARALQERLNDIRFKYEALKLARDELSYCIQEMQREFFPAITESASEMFRKLSDGKYRTIELDDDLNVGVVYSGRLLAPEQLSSGTFDQLYFSVRVAVADVLSRHKSLPLFLDDPFVYFDERRLATARAIVSELARDRQIFLFSHDHRYADWGGKVLQLG